MTVGGLFKLKISKTAKHQKILKIQKNYLHAFTHCNHSNIIKKLFIHKTSFLAGKKAVAGCVKKIRQKPASR
jgi:hypothetical protein